MNSTSTTTIVENLERNTNESETYIITDFFFFIYYLMFLIIILKKHRNQIEPVHLLTLSGLVDLVTVFLNYSIYNLVSLIWSRTGFVFMFSLDSSIWLGFYLDVLAGDINGVIFANVDHVKYHEWITNKKTIVTLIINKFIAVIIVGLTSLESPIPSKSTYICAYAFSNIGFYLSCLPYFLCFFLSVVVLIYMTIVYLKCAIAKIKSQPQEQSIQNQDQNESIQHQSPSVPRSFNPPTCNPDGSVNESQVSIEVENNANQEEENGIELLRLDLAEQIQHISDPINDDLHDTPPSPQVAWFDPTLFTTASCLPPAPGVSLFM